MTKPDALHTPEKEKLKNFSSLNLSLKWPVSILVRQAMMDYLYCRFRPPDACYLEIFRFRVRPPRARELPMQARCVFIVTGQKVEIRADMMIPYHHTKAFGQAWI